ncbi:hypothetical protein [Paenibacillus beijingensis]|uniref:Nucleoside-diphosphate sugar epimerase n=1 Tax=Paenibacillus beijingensis TaxID=1126833 RepID=A0A0D5NF46_9BACL|nr:hypothetical protein [Paenibacillus beijingensis]AJY73602.1 nucleoside-diphosphate sugar epimerase [Paenibacillus beijingensis]
MQHHLDQILSDISHMNGQLARILEAKKHEAVRMAQIVHALPDHHPQFKGVPALLDNTAMVNKNIVAYLNSIADLQHTMAEQLSHIMRELDGEEE